jgi:hypothetical protein
MPTRYIAFYEARWLGATEAFTIVNTRPKSTAGYAGGAQLCASPPPRPARGGLNDNRGCHYSGKAAGSLAPLICDWRRLGQLPGLWFSVRNCGHSGLEQSGRGRPVPPRRSRASALLGGVTIVTLSATCADAPNPEITLCDRRHPAQLAGWGFGCNCNLLRALRWGQGTG